MHGKKKESVGGRPELYSISYLWMPGVGILNVLTQYSIYRAPLDVLTGNTTVTVSRRPWCEKRRFGRRDLFVERKQCVRKLCQLLHLPLLFQNVTGLL